MSGSATLTIVMSIALITIAALITASPRQRRAGSQPRCSSTAASRMRPSWARRRPDR
jgi:hypothetical protein